MCVEVGVLRLDLFELPLCLVKLLPVRPLCQLSEDVSGATVVQRGVGSPSDVLQPVILGLEVRQIVVHPLEGFSGNSHVDRSTFRHGASPYVRLGPAASGG